MPRTSRHLEIPKAQSLNRAIAAGNPRQSFIDLLEAILDSGFATGVSAYENQAHVPGSSAGSRSPVGTEFSQVSFPRINLQLNGQYRIIRRPSADRNRDLVIEPRHLCWIRPNDWYFVRNDVPRTLLAIVFHAHFTRYVWLHRGPAGKTSKRKPAIPVADAPITMLHYHTHAPASAELARMVALVDSSAAPAMDNRTLLHTSRALLAWCLHELKADAGTTSSEPGRRMFEEICAYITEHLGTGLDRGQVAGYFGISTDHLTRLFRQHARHGFVEFVRTERFKQAEKLLLNSRLSIKEVSAACGFNMSDYFIKRFREQHGLPPAAWRRDPSHATSESFAPHSPAKTRMVGRTEFEPVKV